MLLLLFKTLLLPALRLAHFPQEGHVRFPARKVAAAAQQQRLGHRSFEAVMALLGVAVLVTLSRIDRLRPDLVVRHHRLITTREKLRTRRLHRQAHPIAAMLDRHAAQRPHCVLKAFAEALETLREAERHVLPVRVRQHEVIDQMRERFAVDRHAQIGHVREVRGAQPARHVLLREEDLLVRPARGPPLFDPPLQGPQLLLGESTRMPPLQFLEERLGFPARTLFEQCLDFAPDVGERIFAGPLRPRACLRRPLRRQPIRLPMLPCRLAIHACLRRRQRQRRLLAEPGPEHPDLPIRDHRATPFGRRNRDSLNATSLARKPRKNGSFASSLGKCNCRRWGIVVVVNQLDTSRFGMRHVWSTAKSHFRAGSRVLVQRDLERWPSRVSDYRDSRLRRVHCIVLRLRSYGFLFPVAGLIGNGR